MIVRRPKPKGMENSMSMYKCPVCGELFSTSYKKCPFCEEDDLMASDAHKRGNRHHHRRRNEPRAVGPVLIVIFLLLAALVVFLVAGDSIFGGKDPAGEDQPPVSDVIGGEEGEGSAEGSGEGEQEEEMIPMILDQTSAELEVGGRLVLTASEGTGNYTWTSSDEAVAIVTEGVVDTLTAGTVTITVTDGETNVVCEITVKAIPLTINKTDVSISVGEKFTLTAEGGTMFTYTSDKESVATVNENGVVTGTGKGKANITVSNGSSTQSCIVRVR